MHIVPTLATEPWSGVGRPRGAMLVLATAVVLAAATSARLAAADATPGGPPSVVETDSAKRDLAAHRTFGISLDVGVPDGAGLGLVIRPRFDWLRIGAAATYNGMAPGVRLGVTIDPSGFPLAPTFTVEGGHYLDGRVPLSAGSTSVGYNYANLHLGLEVGNRAAFRFFLRGGASWLDVRTANFQSASGSAGIGDPSYSGWLAPSGKLGFSAYF